MCVGSRSSRASATNSSRNFGCPSFRRETSSAFLRSRGFPEEVGQPFLFVQGYQMFSPEFEVEAFRTPAPKICVARWLADVVRGLGSPPQQAVHIPCGLWHDKYRVKTDLEERPLQVSMIYNAAPTKSANYGLDALALVKARIPSTRMVVFGGTDPTYEIPDGITYLNSPTQSVIVDDIYNQSRGSSTRAWSRVSGWPASRRWPAAPRW